MDGHSLPFRIRLSGVCPAKWVSTAPASQPHPPMCWTLLQWNSLEKTFDCPCHGSHFDRYGKASAGASVCVGVGAWQAGCLPECERHAGCRRCIAHD